jgi:hypothetical protein
MWNSRCISIFHFFWGSLDKWEERMQGQFNLWHFNLCRLDCQPSSNFSTFLWHFGDLTFSANKHNLKKMFQSLFTYLRNSITKWENYFSNLCCLYMNTSLFFFNKYFVWLIYEKGHKTFFMIDKFFFKFV